MHLNPGHPYRRLSTDSTPQPVYFAYTSGPYYCNGLGLSLWDYVENEPCIEEDSKEAVELLLTIYEILRGYSGELPVFTEYTDECKTLLEDASMLPELLPNDRNFLLQAYDEYRALLTTHSYELIPLHGDAGYGNVVCANGRLLWSDFQGVCLGPKERDFVSFSNSAKSHIQLNKALLELLSKLGSVCVAVWCSVEPNRTPKIREAVDVHVKWLRSLR